MHRQLLEGIDWVGHIDWTVRDFHGYETSAGSTYNSYLIRDEKTALIDAVKAPYVADLLANLVELIDPNKIDYVVCNHAEPDHSGGFPAVMGICKKAVLVCDAKCKDALEHHYDTKDWRFLVVREGETLSLGKRTLQFIETPMAHWPESMATYIPEDKLLFSMDAFGQHYASSERFDDEADLPAVLAEAKKYYANILMLYGKPVASVLNKLASVPCKLIAPSHGIVWRKNVATILEKYRDWSSGKLTAKVVVAYESMWKSTESMAAAIVEGVMLEGVEVTLLNMRQGEITRLADEVLDAAVLACGSPTLNMNLMPQMAAALTYLKGLKATPKAGLVFGSYGWAKSGPEAVAEYLRAMKIVEVQEPLLCRYVPTAGDLSACRQAGRLLAQKARELAK